MSAAITITVPDDNHALISLINDSEKWSSIGYKMTRLFLSQPVADLYLNGFYHFQAVRIIANCRASLKTQPAHADYKKLIDFYENEKKEAKGRLIASAIRVGIIALGILATGGLVFGAAYLGTLFNSIAIEIALTVSAFVAPFFTVAFVDKRSGWGIANAATTGGVYTSIAMLNIPGIIGGLCIKIAELFAGRMPPAVSMSDLTWVDSVGYRMAEIPREAASKRQLPQES